MTTFPEAFEGRQTPALLIGNGINRFRGAPDSSWENLLGALARDQGLNLKPEEALEMSNTELFDILDLARPSDDDRNLRREFCGLMGTWMPGEHHIRIVDWARRKNTPIVTVNFDENLSLACDAKFSRHESGFTDYYPWSSYFSDREIAGPRSHFAIWHAHGMMRYARSVRLGLTDYMGSVQRARSWVYGSSGLRPYARKQGTTWRGADTWLEVLFFSPLVIIGFGFGKDEIFLRWLFLERARLHKIVPAWKKPTWYVSTASNNAVHRRVFFDRLGIEFIIVPDHQTIYDSPVWLR